MKFTPILFLLIALIGCKKDSPIYTPDFCGKDSIAFYGDSEFDDVPYVTSIPQYYERMTGCTVFHGGVSGQTAKQVADRAVKRTTFLNCPMVIWAGVNDNWPHEAIIADYHRIIGDNPDFLIVLVTNGDGPDYWPGTPWNIDNDLFKSKVIAEFGIEHTIDPKDLNIGLFDDYAEEHDVVSARYRSDFLHMNSLGNFEFTKLILAKVRKCQTGAN